MKQHSRPWTVLPLMSFFVLLNAMSVGCANQSEIAAQRAADTRYGAYQTFHVLQQPVGQAPASDVRLAGIMEAAMSDLGYKPAALGQADLIVSYKLLLSGQPVDAAPLRPGARLRGVPPLGAAWDGALHAEFMDDVAVASAAKRKVLLVLLQETGTYRVVWIGWAMGDVGADEIDSRALDSIRTIMKHVPRRQ